MQKKVELRVGGKGEIYTTDEVRRAVGIEPHTVVLAEVGGKQLVLRPKEKAEQLLEKARFDVRPIGPKELSRVRRKMAGELGQR